MDLNSYAYLVYLLISILLTVWVARTLHRHGQHFLVDVFGGDEKLASSVNHLLVVGFYLINLGYVTLALKISAEIADLSQGIEALSKKIGFVLLVLGGMHFFNLYVFSRMRRAARMAQAPPPLPPDGQVAAGPV